MKQIGLKPDDIWTESIEMYTTFALKSFRDEDRVISSAFLFPQTRPKWPIKIINGLVQGVLGKNKINQYGFVYSKSGIIFGIEDCNNLNFIFPPKSIQLLLRRVSLWLVKYLALSRYKKVIKLLPGKCELSKMKLVLAKSKPKLVKISRI